MAPRNATQSRPKDAIAMLHADHQQVRQLFRAYRTARDLAMQWEIAQHIFDELDVHTQLEEVVFYQAVEEETTSHGKRLVHASLEEHQEALALMQDLRSLAPGCPEFDTKLQALVLTVEHHMTEEETEMFPLAEAEVGEDLCRTYGTRCCTSRHDCSRRNGAHGPWAADECRGRPHVSHLSLASLKMR
jgi:hemerythrin-like domain-containing protein